jgi:hypothetical protein
MTNKVMSNENANKFLKVKEIGEEKYNKFIEERLTGEMSIWDTIRKEKIPTFVNNSKQITVAVNKELVNLKEERKLMSRFSNLNCRLRSRSRPDRLSNMALTCHIT